MSNKLNLFILFLLFPLSLCAIERNFFDVKVGDIYYSLNNKTKEATVVMGSTESEDEYGGHPIPVSSYSGNITIPEAITYNGETFSVTAIKGREGNSHGVYFYGAFEGCNELTSVSIPATIKKIGPKAFAECTSLNAVYISDLSAWCNINFELGYRNESYCPYTNPLYFAHNLYLNDVKISDLIIPKDITAIQPGAFIGANFISVSFHKEILSIGGVSFDNCNDVKDVYSYSPCIYINNNYPDDDLHAFPNRENITLHIRERYKDKYEEKYYGWTGFKKIEYIQGVDFKLKYIVDGEEYKSQLYEAGEKITPEREPSKDGYTFSGWSEIPTTMPEHDVTVTGTFTPKVYKLTYMVDEKEYKVCELKCDSVITPEQEPTRKGMTFSGWSEIPEKMPAKDVIVTGSFGWSKLTKNKVIYEVADTLQNNCKVIGNDNASGEVKIESVEIDGCYYQPTEIAEKAFDGCKDITKIEIPKTVGTIGERAFANIDKLTDVTCWAEEVPTTDRTVFENSYVEDYVTLHVPASAMEKYKATAPWKSFKELVAIGGTEPLKKCSVPTIDYRDGKLVVNCDTEGSECITTITSDDFGEHQSNEIDITATYNISVFSKAEGYANSDLVTATLCWIEVEGTPTKINENIKSKAALIQSYGGTIKVSGNGLEGVIAVYNTAGQLVGDENAVNGTATIITNLKAGDIAFVKIGKKTVKILLR